MRKRRSPFHKSSVCAVFWALFAFPQFAGVHAQGESQSAPENVEKCGLWEVVSRCSDGERLKVNGISLYYEVHGQGEPLLLMHGAGGSAENFNLMLPELSKHYRVITPDTRAQGRSTDADGPVSYRGMVEDMIALLDALEIDSAYVGGWSDGAAIALHMAIYHPTRVRALLLTPVDLSPDGLVDSYWEETEQHAFPEKLVTWWRTRAGPTEQELVGISIPTLFVIGKEEQYVKPEHLAWQYQSIPGAEVVWIPSVDHMLVTKPDAVSEAFLSFLESQ